MKIQFSKHKSRKRWIVSLVVLTLFLFLLARLWYVLTDDFHFANITSPKAQDKSLAIETTLQEKAFLKKILDQPYRYLGKGAQCYAFGSEDGHYVIKFFKFKHLRPSLIVTLLPPAFGLKEFKEKNVARKKRKLDEVFQGHFIAYKYDRDYSGLTYIHLTPTDDLHLTAKVVDKLGLNHQIPLDPIVFVIQKRGKTYKDVVGPLLMDGRVDEAVDRATSVLDMYIEEYKRGIWDRDHGISHNIGFIGERPFHLDIGKIALDSTFREESFYKNDLRRVVSKMWEFAEEQSPEHADEFHDKLERKLEERLSQLTLPSPLSLL